MRHLLRHYSESDATGCHSHDIGQLIYLHHGAVLLESGQAESLLLSGQLLYLPPGCEHAHRLLKYTRCSLFYFRPEVLPQHWQSHGLHQGPAPMSVSPLWSALLQRLETVTEDKEAAYLEVLQDNLCQLQPQGRLEPLYQSLDPRLLPVIETMQRSPNLKLRLEDFSKHCGASERTLNRLFRVCLGVSFKDWRRRSLMLEAQRRLRQGQPMTQVALELGYLNLSAFSAAYHNFFRRQSYPQ
ncbi:helix-turn-helix domain-containing protein [Shewanella algae]|uniref:helix-turn-helix domain-containing protein n=1 Tax=Shewanella algae TaxID=38313 RepID=UPI0011B70694|nr:helix-turn-helix domain-containing protein [Shewanella algae]